MVNLAAGRRAVHRLPGLRAGAAGMNLQVRSGTNVLGNLAMTEQNAHSAFDTPLWVPDAKRVAGSNLVQFIGFVNERHRLSVSTSRQLHAWSIQNLAAFWSAIWDFCGIKGTKGDSIVLDAEHMPGARFFPQASLNFAENLLRRHDDSLAMVFRGEDKVEKRLTWAELGELVSRLQ